MRSQLYRGLKCFESMLQPDLDDSKYIPTHIGLIKAPCKAELSFFFLKHMAGMQAKSSVCKPLATKFVLEARSPLNAERRGGGAEVIWHSLTRLCMGCGKPFSELAESMGAEGVNFAEGTP